MNKQFAYISEATIPHSFGWVEEIIGENSRGPIKTMVLEGEFQHADTPNRNKRIYSESLLMRETNKLKQFIEERSGLPQGLDHPLPGDSKEALILIQRVGIENACALCTHLEMQGPIVYGKSKVLEGDFGTGDKLATLVRNGFKPAVSSRGVGGNPVYNNTGFIMVPEDYNMITYDYVTNPSTFNAILSQQINEEIALYESQTSKIEKRKFYEVLIDLSKKQLGE